MGVLIPVALAVPISRFLNKKLINETNVLKSFGIKSIILLPLSTITTYIATKTGDYINKKITERVIEKEFWEQLEQKEKSLNDYLIKNYFKLNSWAKKSLQDKLIVMKKIKTEKSGSKN